METQCDFFATTFFHFIRETCKESITNTFILWTSLCEGDVDSGTGWGNKSSEVMCVVIMIFNS